MSKVKREYISKKIREQVYDQYDGHCAYCGKKIEYGEMQVDHIVPFREAQKKKRLAEKVQNISNYRCACRMCNYYKRARGVESMRKDIENICTKLEKTFLYRLAIRYGFIKEFPHKVVFYFETHKRKNINDR